jgi:hypothetical protein
MNNSPPSEGSGVVSYRLSKRSNDNADETRNNLLEDLLKYDFSASPGIKYVIDNGVLSGIDRIDKRFDSLQLQLEELQNEVQ